MKGGLIRRARRQRAFKILLGVGSILFLIFSVVARADVETPEPIDRNHVIEIVGPPRGMPLEGQALAETTHELASLLRCTTCQGSSVADSPSTGALNMRREVEDLLAIGFSGDQVLAYFESKYGQFVLLQPKAEGLNLLVWIGPGMLLLLGAGILVVYLRRGAEEPDDEELADASLAIADDDEDLAPWVQKVRELAYGREET